MDVLIERAEHRKIVQQRAFDPREFLERAGVARLLKSLKRPAQRAQLDVRDALVFHQFGLAQRDDLPLRSILSDKTRDALHVQIEIIPIQTSTAADTGWCCTAGGWESRAADSAR